MADSSFDIVSKIDRQEVDNALGQTAREIATRFDFKGTGATIEWQGDEAIEISASADDRASAVLEVFKQKLVKRQVSLKVLEDGAGAVVGGGTDLDGLIALPLDGGAGALEVEPHSRSRAQFAQRVSPLDLAHDVERRVGHLSPLAILWRGARCAYCFASLSTGQAGSSYSPFFMPEHLLGGYCKSVQVWVRRFESCTCHPEVKGRPPPSR